MNRKILQFTIPLTQKRKSTVVVDDDRLPYFFNHYHRHPEVQITCILRGRGRLIAGNYTQPFKEGDIYMISANQPHIFKSDPDYFRNIKSDNVHAIHIYFDYSKLRHCLSTLSETQNISELASKMNGNSGFQAPDAIRDVIIEIVNKINNLTGLDRLTNFLILMDFIASHIDEWKRLSTGLTRHAYANMQSRRMSDVYQFTIEHYDENISLADVSAIANMTIPAFCKYFKKHTRKTYAAFLNEFRINEACKKIISGKFENVTSIAYSTGFNSPISFNRVFKKITGFSPTEYIRHHFLQKKESEATKATYINWNNRRVEVI